MLMFIVALFGCIGVSVQTKVDISKAFSVDGLIVDMLWIKPTSTSRFDQKGSGIDPNEQVVFIVTDNRTLWRSDDAGWSWKSQMSKLTAHPAHEHGGSVPPVGVTRIHASKADSTHLLFEGRHGNFWATRDGGQSYFQLPKMWTTLVPHPRERDLVMGLLSDDTSDAVDLKISTDFGRTWTKAASNVGKASWASDAELATKAHTMLATVKEAGTWTLYKSHDLFATKTSQVDRLLALHIGACGAQS